MTDDATVEAVLDDGHSPAGAARTVRLRWSARDPLAVRLAVDGVAGGPWVVLRDTLRAGTTQPTGIGQVRVGPAGSHVAVTLHDPGGLVVVRIEVDRLRGFLAETDAVVAPGTEACAESLDAVLDAIIDGA